MAPTVRLTLRISRSMRTGVAVVERRHRLGDQLVVERACRARGPASRNGGWRRRAAARSGAAGARSRAPWPSSGRSPRRMSSRSTRPTISSNRAEAELGHQLAHLLGDEEEVVDDVLGLAGEVLAQHRVLRRDADRAGVQMALAHHDAAGGDQRRRREAELVGAQQRADHHVAPGAEAAVDLHARCARAARSAPASAASRRGRSPTASRHG